MNKTEFKDKWGRFRANIPRHSDSALLQRDIAKAEWLYNLHTPRPWPVRAFIQHGNAVWYAECCAEVLREYRTGTAHPDSDPLGDARWLLHRVRGHIAAKDYERLP